MRLGSILGGRRICGIGRGDVPVVDFSDAVVEPYAVVVEDLHTPVACPAVLGPGPHMRLAELAKEFERCFVVSAGVREMGYLFRSASRSA